MRQLIGPILFMLSAGLFFNEREKRNVIVVGIAGTVAIIATFFTVEQLVELIASHLKGTHDHQGEIAAAIITAVGSIFAAVIGVAVGAMINRPPKSNYRGQLFNDSEHEMQATSSVSPRLANGSNRRLPRNGELTYDGVPDRISESDQQEIRARTIIFSVGVICLVVGGTYIYFVPLDYADLDCDFKSGFFLLVAVPLVVTGAAISFFTVLALVEIAKQRVVKWFMW